jgi:hypothetical protein
MRPTEPYNFRRNPLAGLKHDETDCAHVCFIKPFWSIVSLCLFRREAAACKFLIEPLLGFICEAAVRPKLQKLLVVESLVVGVESLRIAH